MKGLLLKDVYTVMRQMKFFLLMVLIFACMPGYSMLTFALVYSSMLPMTALAYDERSGWDKLAAMMPYSAGDIVLSKYLLGYIMIAGATVFSVIIQFALSLLGMAKPMDEAFVQIITAICVALLFEAIVLPLMVKLGVEKGRIVFLGVAAAVGIFVMYSYKSIDMFKTPSDINANALGAAALLAAAAMNAISIMLSEKFYRNKKE